MSYMNTEKPPEKWSASFFKMFVERVRLAVNYLDDSNFPNGLNGTLINDYTIPFKKLGGIEIQHTIFSQIIAYSSSSTSLINLGGYLVWDTIWGKDVTLYFEVVGGSTTISNTATFELHGLNGKIAEVSSNTGKIEVLRSQGFSPPTTGQTLLVKAKTSSSSFQVLSARLIIRSN